MPEKKLTDDQLKRIEKLKKEMIDRGNLISEPQKPHNKLDGGGGPFHDFGMEFQKRLQEIVNE